MVFPNKTQDLSIILSPLLQAFVIAYTSDFIPRMVYKYKYSPTDDLVGYIDASLSGIVLEDEL